MARGAWLGVAMLAVTCGGAAAADDGTQLFINNCSACHRQHGEGTPNLAPPLVSPVLKAAVKAGAADYPAKVVLNGLSGPITINGQPFVSAMPARAELSDAEIAAIVAHVLVDLNGIAAEGAGLPDAAAVAALRQTPVGHAELRGLRKGFVN
jgi:mono/diheme cytochrome c family protein